MGLNLSQFKKMKEDSKTVTMAHPKGHSITILKSRVSPSQRKQLEKLPVHLADGGAPDDLVPKGAPSPEDVKNSQPLTPDELQAIQKPGTNIVASNDPTSGIPNVSYSPDSPIQNNAIDPNQEPDGEQAAATQAAPDNRAPSSLQTPNGIQLPGSPVDVNAAYQQGQKAIQEEKDISTQLAQRNAQIEAADIEGRKALQSDAQTYLKQFQQHRDEFANYIANNPIDPKHYQENMSSGQKVSTAIGLLLGGLGSGLLRTGTNPALDFLNKQIDRDIEGQRSRMDQQRTLLGANQDLYHDQVTANNQARINMNDIYNRKIQLAASQLGTPQAQQIADAASSKFALENNNLLINSSVRSAALQRLAQGGNGLDPITLGQAGIISPEEAQKEQAAFDTQKAGIAKINQLYAQLNEETSPGKLLNLQSYARAQAIKSQIRNTVLSMDINHRYSPEAAEALIEPNLFGTFADKETRDLKQANVLQQAAAIGAGSMPNFARLAPGALPNYSLVSDDQKAIQAAQNRLKINPNDPVALKALQLNGISTTKMAR